MYRLKKIILYQTNICITLMMVVKYVGLMQWIKLSNGKCNFYKKIRNGSPSEVY